MTNRASLSHNPVAKHLHTFNRSRMMKNKKEQKLHPKKSKKEKQ